MGLRVMNAAPQAQAGHAAATLCTGATRSACASLAWGLTLTCRGSKATSRVITAHRMRAFLLAMATQAFCQPTRAVSCTSQREVASSLLAPTEI
jgi:hypothetical protein